MAKHSDKKPLTRDEKMLLVAPLFVLLSFSPAKISRSQTAVRCSVYSFESSVAKLPPAEQEAFFRKMRRQRFPVFLDLPSYWNSVDDLNETFSSVQKAGEPLTKPMLDALERNFAKSRDKRLRSLAAELLYRYSRAMGRVYLLQQLQKGDVEAATIFALNREVSLLPLILKTLETEDEALQNDPSLVRALGKWRRPEIKNALLKRFKIALGEEQGGWFNYVYALADQNAREAIPLIRRAGKLVARDKDFETDDTAVVAGALIKLQAPERVRSMIYLRQQFETKEKTFSRRAVVEALGIAATPEAVTALQTLIKRYLAAPRPVKNPPYRAIVETTSADELAVLAAEQLGNLQSENSQNLTAQLLTRLEKERVFNRSANNEYSKRTARAFRLYSH